MQTKKRIQQILINFQKVQSFYLFFKAAYVKNILSVVHYKIINGTLNTKFQEKVAWIIHFSTL